MSRFTKVVAAFGAVSVLLLSVGWQLANAQTPAQMEYERQQREYRQQQEQQRQDQQRLQQLQNDNARRQQEEQNRSMRALTPSPQGPQYPSTQGPSTSPSTSRPSTVQNICKVKPVRVGERNPLIGQWRYVGPQAGGSDFTSEVLQLAAAMSCPVFNSGFDFRAKSIIARGNEIPANYGRDGDTWWVCAGDSYVNFRVANSNRLHMVDPRCAFERAGGSPGAQAAAATPASGQAGISALSLAAGFAAPGSALQPLVGGSFFVLKESADAILAKGTFNTSSGMSPLKAWTIACSNGQPTCGQGMIEIVKHSAAVLKTDTAGRAQLPALPSGTYYVFGLNKLNAQAMLWHVRADLKQGANTVTLDQRNGVSLN